MPLPTNPVWTLGKPTSRTDGSTVWRPRRRKSVVLPSEQRTFATREEAVAWIEADRAAHQGSTDKPTPGPGRPRAHGPKPVVVLEMNRLPLRDYFVIHRAVIVHGIKASTLTGYEIQWRKRVEPRFGDTPIGEITMPEVRAWVRSFVAEKSSTQRQALAMLSKILSFAYDEGHIPSNPVLGVYRHVPKPQTISRVRVLPVKVCLAMGEEIEPRYRALIHIMAFGGLRINEALALDARDVQPLRTGDGYTIDVHKNLERQQGGYRYGTVKTVAGNRIVPIRNFPEFDAAIEDHFAQFGATSPMFITPTGAPLLYTNFLVHHWNKLVKTMGFQQRHTPHDLRHTAASWWIDGGYSVLEVMRWMGHANSSITLDVYGHLFDLAAEAKGDPVRTAQQRERHGLPPL